MGLASFTCQSPPLALPAALRVSLIKRPTSGGNPESAAKCLRPPLARSQLAVQPRETAPSPPPTQARGEASRVWPAQGPLGTTPPPRASQTLLP